MTRESEETLRLAIVVQRYGEEVSGGAELHARWLAEHLAPYANIEVLTTRALDYISWANHFPPGEAVVNGIRVRRFTVDRERRIPDLIRSSNFVFHQPHSLLDEYEWLQVQGPVSAELLTYIADHRDDYHIFIFFTYEYASTAYGIQIVPDKSILVPTAHDNDVLRLPLFRNTFHLPRHIAYNTKAERTFVNRITRNAHVPGTTVGIGINIPDDVDAARFRRKYDLSRPFLLYVGRVDPAKNLNQMFDYYLRYAETVRDPAPLVLMGRAVMPLPEHPGIISLGHVSEQDKFDGMAAASLFLLPSLHESLSMVLLEAWLAGTAVMVHGECEVTRVQVQLSNGGIYYHDHLEFATGVSTLLADPGLCEHLGRQGQAFARANYNWDTIVTKYLAMFRDLLDTA